MLAIHNASMGTDMSIAIPVNFSEPTPLPHEFAIRACTAAREAAALCADLIASGRQNLLEKVGASERELDSIDRAMDEEIAFLVTQTTVNQARHYLAYMKFVVDLERIGDLLSSFAGRAAAVRARLDTEDTEALVKMATLLEKMLADAEFAFVERDLEHAIAVIRADAEIDRVRNLIFARHLEDKETVRRESSQVLLMAQALERAGDHAKNLGEEVCHFVSGRTVRHVLRSADKPLEQLFLDWLKQKSIVKDAD